MSGVDHKSEGGERTPSSSRRLFLLEELEVSTEKGESSMRKRGEKRGKRW